MRLDEFQVGSLSVLHTIYSCSEQEAEENFKKKRREQQVELEKVYNIDFIRQNPDQVNWLYLTVWKEMDESFMREFRDYLDWKLISKYQNFNKDFEREIENNLK